MSTAPNSDRDTEKLSRDAAGKLVEQLIRSKEVQDFSAREVLDRHPDLNGYRTCILDLAYEEYCRRRERGVPTTPSMFVKSFPTIEQSLCRVIEIDQALHSHPNLIQGVPEERWPEVGDNFLGFELLEAIGKGLLSRVFVATETAMERRVILKVCVRGDREALMQGTLDHAHITRVNSISKDANTGLGALCMPFQTRATMHHLAEEMIHADSEKRRLEVTDLRRHIRDLNTTGVFCVPQSHHDDPRRCRDFHPSDNFETILKRWAIQLALALAHAHSKQVLHCDVKPGNVLLLDDLSAQLVDFNLATSATDPIRLAGGTLPFMASEQLQLILAGNSVEASDRPVDPSVSEPQAEVVAATDVFGLSATLWHMATGAPPFGESVDLEHRSAAVQVQLDRQRSGISEEQRVKISGVLSRPFIELLQKGLSYDPRARFQTAEEFCQALRRITPDAEDLAARRRKRVTLSVSAALTITLIGAVAVPQLIRSPSDDKPPATDAASRLHAVRRDVQELIALRQYHEAREAAKEFSASDPELRFLDLYCQTCQLPPLQMKFDANSLNDFDSRAGGQSHLLKLLEPATVQQWNAVLAEWKELSRLPPFEMECHFNLAFLSLELGDLNTAVSSFAECSDLMDEGALREFAVVLRQITEEQAREHFDNGKDLQTLQNCIEQNGTRGQLIAYLMLATEEIKQTNQNRNSTELTMALWKYLERHMGVQIEPGAVSLLFGGHFGFRQSLLRREMLRAHGQHAPQNPTTIDAALRCPSSSALPVADL